MLGRVGQFDGVAANAIILPLWGHVQSLHAQLIVNCELITGTLTTMSFSVWCNCLTWFCSFRPVSDADIQNLDKRLMQTMDMIIMKKKRSVFRLHTIL